MWLNTEMKVKLISCLRDMDDTQRRTDEDGEREIAWYYCRDHIEDILDIPRGSLNSWGD